MGTKLQESVNDCITTNKYTYNALSHEHLNLE